MSITFSAIFEPVSLFSLKISTATNSAAQSLLLPSPYAIKMAILSQAITLDGINFEEKGQQNEAFNFIKTTQVSYFIQGNFCVNNCFVKILKPSRTAGEAVQRTVSFREYVHLSHPVEIIFEVVNQQAKTFLMRYLHKINYFGKRGCFFQFRGYSETSSTPNVCPFDAQEIKAGVIQVFDDFPNNSSFNEVNNFSKKRIIRSTQLALLPISRQNSAKSFTHYQVIS